MAQRVKAPVTKPDDLSSMPRTHTGRREAASASCPPSSTHAIMCTEIKPRRKQPRTKEGKEEGHAVPGALAVAVACRAVNTNPP